MSVSILQNMPIQRLIAGMPQQLGASSSPPPTNQQAQTQGAMPVSPERSKLSIPQQGGQQTGRGPSPQPAPTGPPPQAPSRLSRRMQTQEDRDMQQLRQKYDEE